MPWCCWCRPPVPDFPADPTLDLPFAHGGPALSGVLRASPEDFVVEEQLGYAASGEGEHAFLQVRKRGLNTADVARELARFAGVRQVNVGFAGLKDRHALTTQYFSVHLPGKPDPDWQALNSEQLQIVSAQRHNRKIRRGSLQGNRFELTLRQLQGGREQAEQQLLTIAAEGVPNYFGAQRFGREASNLQRAAALFAGQGRRPKPEQLRMIVSAARSYLFNRVLAARVSDGSWNRALPGDVMLLAGSNRQFAVEQLDAEIERRLAEHDIHPSGPLPGADSRSLKPQAEALRIEQQALSDELAQAWIEGLAKRRVDADRRALRMAPGDFSYDWPDRQTLRLSFTLTSGAFATSLVRELLSTAS